MHFRQALKQSDEEACLKKNSLDHVLGPVKNPHPNIFAFQINVNAFLIFFNVSISFRRENAASLQLPQGNYLSMHPFLENIVALLPRLGKGVSVTRSCLIATGVLSERFVSAPASPAPYLVHGVVLGVSSDNCHQSLLLPHPVGKVGFRGSCLSN